MIGNLFSAISIALMSSVLALGQAKSNSINNVAAVNENRVVTTSKSWLGDWDVNVIPLNNVDSYVSQNVIYNNVGSSFFVDYNGGYHSLNVSTLPSVDITNKYTYAQVLTQTEIAIYNAGHSSSSDYPALFGITWVVYSRVGGNNVYNAYIYGSSYNFVSMNDANVNMAFDGFEFHVSSWVEGSIPTMRFNNNFVIDVETNYGYFGTTLLTDGTLNTTEKYLKAFNDVEISSTNTSVSFAFRLLCNYQQSSFYAYGYTNGYTTGSAEGYAKGYAEGLGVSTNSSFMGLFSSIADTPLRFIYGLFNFDLFGTSVLVIVLTLLTGIIVFGIVKKFWK